MLVGEWVPLLVLALIWALFWVFVEISLVAIFPLWEFECSRVDSLTVNLNSVELDDDVAGSMSPPSSDSVFFAHGRLWTPIRAGSLLVERQHLCLGRFGGFPLIRLIRSYYTLGAPCTKLSITIRVSFQLFNKILIRETN